MQNGSICFEETLQVDFLFLQFLTMTLNRSVTRYKLSKEKVDKIIKNVLFKCLMHLFNHNTYLFRIDFYFHIIILVYKIFNNFIRIIFSKC